MELYNPKWIMALADEMGLIDREFTKDEISLICQLFKDYYNDDITAREALEKAILITNQFRKNA